MIDRKLLNDHFLGDNDFIVTLIDQYFPAYDDYMGKIRADLESRNFESLAFFAHKLKGLIVLFWDPVATEIAERFVRMAKDKSETGLENTFNELETKSIALNEEIRLRKQEFTS